MLMVIYARASPGEHSRRSVPEQLRLGRQKAVALAGGAPLELREFEDPETSGDISPHDRPGFAGALATARTERAAYFICLDPDRFSRDVYQALGAAQEVDATGARLTFVLHEYDMSPEGRLFFTLRIAIAEYEKHKIRERTQRGIRAKLARGGLPYAPRPYGYRFNKETDSLEVVPEQAWWVRQIYRWVTEAQMGPQLIARQLNGLGVPAARGHWWYKQAVSRIVRNPVYKGALVVNKTDQSGMRRNRHLPPDQRISRRSRPPEQWITLPAAALVSPETWAEAQAVLAARRQRRLAHRRGAYLLTGLCTCGRCGRPCHGFSNGRGCRYYVCGGRRPRERPQPPAAPCTLPYQRAEAVEQQALAQVRGWLRDADAYQAARLLALSPAGPHGTENGLHRLRQVRSQLEQEWDRRLDAFQRGLVRDPGRALRDLEAIRRRVESLRSQEEALVQAAERAGCQPETAGLAVDMEARLHRLDREEWCMAFRMLVDRVTLHPGAVIAVTPRA